MIKVLQAKKQLMDYSKELTGAKIISLISFSHYTMGFKADTGCSSGSCSLNTFNLLDGKHLIFLYKPLNGHPLFRSK